jgi:ATP-dependent Clp protease ATP-binding subunit ClpA
VAGEYFLTHQQEEIKNKVLKAAANKSISRFISITGSAGTGKTLLVYDIAKEMLNTKKKVLIIHCGQLNAGQYVLKHQCQWEVAPIKHYAGYNLPSYDMIIVDEAQRVQAVQLDKIVSELQATNSICIFSYDKRQTLANWEEQRNIDGHINNIGSIVTYKLTDKMRTNKEMASFIMALFDKKKNSHHHNMENIELNYFCSVNDAKIYLDSLCCQNWEVIRFTPSQYDKEHHTEYSSLDNQTSHNVIGQEFDNVVVVIDQFFSYSNNGELIYKGGAYYDPVKMLFQNITRTVKRLNLVILNNIELLNRCISIIKA